jgi:mannitol operon repressor
MKTPISDPYYSRLNTFLHASNDETSRGRALVAASLIDEMLDELLRSFLLDGRTTKRLFDGANAPLSTLSAKSLMCRSLCLISSFEFEDIELVRRIRNEFAHSVLCSFDDEKIRDWGKKLKFGMQTLDALEVGHESRVDDAQQRFGMVTTSLISGLYNRAHYVKKNKIEEVIWPPCYELV